MSSIAVGKEAIATTETSTSLGQNSQATANNAVAIGNKAVAAGTGNIVVGTNAGVYDAAVSAGRTVGADTVYIGADSGRNAYTNERQISIGKGRHGQQRHRRRQHRPWSEFRRICVRCKQRRHR